MDILSQDHIVGFTILGGEPLELKNQDTILNLIIDIKEKYPNKDIWLYSGYTIEQLLDRNNETTTKILKNIDTLVDGEFVEDLKDPSLKFRGSSNQRIIDTKEYFLKLESQKDDIDESFYEKICRAYIDTMNLEWVATNPENNDSVVHGYFSNDDIAEKWNYGYKITPENFKDAAYDGYTEEDLDNQVSKLVDDIEWYEYDTWKDFYEDYIKNEIAYDINDIGVYSDGTTNYASGINHWDFYISEDDLTKLGLWNKDKKIEELWEQLEDVPFIEDEEHELILDDDFLGFKKGTTREEIWHFFDERHSKGIYYLLYEYESAKDEDKEKLYIIDQEDEGCPKREIVKVINENVNEVTVESILDGYKFQYDRKFFEENKRKATKEEIDDYKFNLNIEEDDLEL